MRAIGTAEKEGGKKNGDHDSTFIEELTDLFMPSESWRGHSTQSQQIAVERSVEHAYYPRTATDSPPLHKA